MTYGFFLVVLSLLSLFALNTQRKYKTLLAKQQQTKLLTTNVKEAELQLKEAQAELEMAKLELDTLTSDLDRAKEKLLDSIGVKGNTIKELDKKIGERQKELNELNASIASQTQASKPAEPSKPVTFEAAIEVIEYLIGAVGVTAYGDNARPLQNNPRKMRALSWLVANGYVATFMKANEVFYSLNPLNTRYSLVHFYANHGPSPSEPR